MSDLRRLQHEIGALPEASVGQASALQRSNAERDHYRRERNELRALRVGALLAPRHSKRDSYEYRGYEPPRINGAATAACTAPRRPLGAAVAMPLLAEVGPEVPRHPSYCPSNPYASGPASSPNGPKQCSRCCDSSSPSFFKPTGASWSCDGLPWGVPCRSHSSGPLLTSFFCRTELSLFFVCPPRSLFTRASAVSRLMASADSPFFRVSVSFNVRSWIPLPYSLGRGFRGRRPARDQAPTCPISKFHSPIFKLLAVGRDDTNPRALRYIFFSRGTPRLVLLQQ